MPLTPKQHVFASRDGLAIALAGTIADALSLAVSERGVGFLAVSGGNTPAQLFSELSQADIPWDKVVVTLVDERMVPASSPRSNARLAMDKLLQGHARAARFVPLYHEADSVEAAAALAGDTLRDLPWPLDVVVVGMGADGHTASFFPDAANLAALTDPESGRVLMPVHAESANEPRLTLTLAPIVNAGLVVLHIEGADKRATLDSVLQQGAQLPIRSVLDHAKRPVEIFWAA